uniref:Succinate dehydrogenase subunit 3 n=2 Tax=Pentapetalae TaxID=1437201 RepID=A0A1C9I9R7_COCAP|nr:succinate dehydrogenase subunit 3 [Corchorus capsularis]AOO95949.1 succinate dehydrogenase subunit 3 [Corchorus capsularis]
MNILRPLSPHLPI